MDTSELKILIIDNDPDYLDALNSVILGALPRSKVFAASGGVKGIELALAEVPDVILVDVRMPGMDGIEVCRRLKADERLKLIPVIFITAFPTGKKSWKELIEAGGDGFLSKPFETVELVAQVRAMAKIKAANIAQAAALSESKARFQELLSHMTSGVAVYEALDGGADFVFKEFNVAAEKIDGMDRKGVIGRRVTEVFPGVREFGIFEVFQRVWRTGKAEYFPQGFYRDQRNSGGWRENWVFRLPAGEIVAVYNDITGRKRAEEELLFSNALLSSQNEAAIDGILVVDGEGKIISYNRRFVEIWGIPEEVVGKKSDELALGVVLAKLENPQEFQERVKHLYAHRDEKSREYVVLRDKRVLDRYSSPVTGYDGKYYGRIWYFRDVTEQRQAEEALRDSENRYRGLFESSQDALMTLGPPSWSFTSGNPATLRLFGAKTAAEFEARTPGDLSPATQPDGRPSAQKALEMIAEAMRKGSHFFEWTHKRIDGSEFPATVLLTRITLSGKDFLQATVRDISEKTQAETAMRQALEMQGVLNVILRSSLANSPLRDKLGGYLANLFSLPWLSVEPKGAVFLVNPAVNALVLAVHKGLPQALTNVCAIVPLGCCICGRAAERGMAVECHNINHEHDIKYEGMLPHGHYCAPIAAEGKVLGVLNLYLREGVPLTSIQRSFISSVTDIMAESILHSRVEETLAQSQKMESVGRLAGGVAHDFNNIITAIRCYAGFVNEGLDPRDPKKADVGEIIEASHRAAAITQRLLAFSRRQLMNPSPLDLNACVGGVADMLRRLIGEDITLETKLSPEPCPAMLDAGQLEQVLVNLVVNSRDAMSKGGRIELSTGLLAPSPELSSQHPDLDRGPLVYVQVTDTGCGMSEEVKSHLFEPFYTTKEKGKGTGLGLSMVFGIVKQSGGDIEVESEPGKGTRFRILFPRTEAKAPAREPVKSEGFSGELAGKETILLVEDEESLLKLGKRVLESCGYVVLAAGGGAAALEEMECHGKPVDLLLTDVIMPGMSGKELAMEIARRGLARKTLYMSGYTEDALAVHGVLEPGIAFIYKPFTIDKLLARVRGVLDGPEGEARA